MAFSHFSSTIILPLLISQDENQIKDSKTKNMKDLHFFNLLCMVKKTTTFQPNSYVVNKWEVDVCLCIQRKIMNIFVQQS